jgi:site-specific DNA-methyltransferase (adenine-specific)
MNDMINENTKFNAIITDIPYGTTACSWDSIIPLNNMWDKINNLIRNNSAICLFSAQPFTSELIQSNIKNYKHYWIWDKEICGAFALAKKRPMIVTEEICIFSKSGGVNYYPIMEDAQEKNIRPINMGSNSSEATPVASGIAKSDKNYNPKKRYPKNIIKYSKYNAECNQLNRVHPTQKPEYIMEYLIKTYTNENDLILDFTCGSGSTLIAAKNLHRKCYGIELEEKYCEIAKQRLLALEKQNIIK